jgi:tRNA(Ile)-lysidine synthetase-like protein
LLEAVRQVIQKFQLIPPASIVLVGVSGGADSLVLLHVLHSLHSGLGFSLHAATLDHSLRGEQSAADVRYVENLCQQWSILVTVGKMDVKAIARERHLSIEAAARLARYDFLADTAHRVGAQRIAVAHHANDQAETVLMHLIRGTGIHGLRGMSRLSPVPDHPDLMLIRPLLSITRAEIERYCEENGLQPRQDASNLDTTILRNHLRLELLPHLATLNPRIQQIIVQLADAAAVEDDYIQSELQRITSSPAVTVGKEQISIRREGFRQLHPALQRRLIAWGLDRLGRAEVIDYAHLLEAVHLGLNGRVGAAALFAGGIRLRVDYESLLIETTDSRVPKMNYPLMTADGELTVPIPGMIDFEGCTLHASPSPITGGDADCRLALPEHALVTLRTRHEGERFTPLGMGGHSQKLNRWMINRKIPRSVRERIPLLCINDEIAALFVDGKWTVSERFAVGKDVTNVTYFGYVPNS